jgi:hypothetical protein
MGMTIQFPYSETKACQKVRIGLALSFTAFGLCLLQLHKSRTVNAEVRDATTTGFQAMIDSENSVVVYK